MIVFMAISEMSLARHGRKDRVEVEVNLDVFDFYEL